jgi:hypothetical protein
MNGMDDQDPTTLSPRADDVTAASAWSSSPLGDPADRAEYHPYRNNLPPDFRPDFRAFPADPITAAGRLKSISKATLAAGLVGTIGVGAALGMAVFVYTNSSQVRPLTVVPGSTGVPAAFPTAGVQSVPRWSARQRRRPPRCRLRGRARTRHRRPRRQRTRRPWPRRRSSPHRRPPPLITTQIVTAQTTAVAPPPAPSVTSSSRPAATTTPATSVRSVTPPTTSIAHHGGGGGGSRSVTGRG